MADTVTRRSLLAISIAVASLLLLGCAGNPASNASTATEAAEFDFTEATPMGQVIPTEVREPAPAFSGGLLDGTDFDSASLDGSITVANFWGSWCAPCRG